MLRPLNAFLISIYWLFIILLHVPIKLYYAIINAFNRDTTQTLTSIRLNLKNVPLGFNIFRHYIHSRLKEAHNKRQTSQWMEKRNVNRYRWTKTLRMEKRWNVFKELKPVQSPLNNLFLVQPARNRHYVLQAQRDRSSAATRWPLMVTNETGSPVLLLRLKTQLMFPRFVKSADGAYSNQQHHKIYQINPLCLWFPLCQSNEVMRKDADGSGRNPESRPHHSQNHSSVTAQEPLRTLHGNRRLD